MLTATKLGELLGWPRVDEKENPDSGGVDLLVQPTHSGLDDIYFGLDWERSSIEYFGFGHWHYHPDTIAEAIETARLLISGERCMIQERDAAGWVLVSS